jgi:hypothetical protein
MQGEHCHVGIVRGMMSKWLLTLERALCLALLLFLIAATNNEFAIICGSIRNPFRMLKRHNKL